LDNKHGEIYLGPIDGEVDIRLAHGRIRTEELNGRSRVDLAFSGGRMKKMAKGNLDLRHTNKLVIDYLGNVEVDLQHTTLDVEEAELVDIVGQHSNIEIGKAISIEGDFQHSDLEIDEVVKVLALQVQHSDLDVRRVHEGFDRIDLDGGFF